MGFFDSAALQHSHHIGTWEATERELHLNPKVSMLSALSLKLSTQFFFGKIILAF